MDTPPQSPATLQRGDDDHRSTILELHDQAWNRWKEQAAGRAGEERLRIDLANEERRLGLERLAQVWLASHGNNR